MGKLVVGIVAVFVLDLALIFFMRSGGDLVELAQVLNEPSVDLVLLSRQLEIPETTGQRAPNKDIYELHPATGPSITPTITVKSSVTERIRSVRKFRTVRKVDNQPYTTKEPAVAFTDTVILVERTSFDPEFEVERLKPPGYTITKASVADFAPRKRSPFRRMGSVVKKPYDWARALATKLF